MGSVRREDLERLEDLEFGLAVVARALEQARQRPHVVGAEDDVDPRRLVEHRLLVHLREAAADGDLHAVVLVLAGLQVPERAVQLAGRVVADGAGVDDDDVGLFAELGADVAGALERAGEPLGVVDVHLAAERAHLVGARAAVGGVRGGRGRDESSASRTGGHDGAILRAALLDDACGRMPRPRAAGLSGTARPTRRSPRSSASAVRAAVPRDRAAEPAPREHAHQAAHRGVVVVPGERARLRARELEARSASSSGSSASAASMTSRPMRSLRRALADRPRAHVPCGRRGVHELLGEHGVVEPAALDEVVDRPSSTRRRSRPSRAQPRLRLGDRQAAPLRGCARATRPRRRGRGRVRRRPSARRLRGRRRTLGRRPSGGVVVGSSTPR